MNQKFTAKLCLSVLILLLTLLLSASGLLAQDSERVIPLDRLAMGGRIEQPQTAEEKPASMESKVFINLGDTGFDPLYNLPSTKAGIPVIKAYGADQTGYYIVQFTGPILPKWKNNLTAAGVEIFDYLPEYAFIVRMRASVLAAVRAMDDVRWVGVYQPSYRISQGALNALYSTRGGDQRARAILRVNLFPGVDPKVVEAAVKALGGSVTEQSVTTLKTSLLVEIPAGRIGELGAIEGVKWVEPAPKWKLSNAVAADIMGVYPRTDHNLYGQGQTVAVADTGLDLGVTSPAELHDDFENGAGVSRVLQIIDRVAADEGSVNDASDLNGHGTHVAGSVLGNGVLSGGIPASNTFPVTCQAGAAPKASLIFQALENNDTGALEGIPNDLNDLFLEADTAGAHIHTNSWGAGSASQYSSYSADVDEYMWLHRDFLILFSAGNEGADLDANGVIDPYSIGAPATAKNCLTIGASENDRPSGAVYDFPWGSGSWSDLYPAYPISADHLSDNENGMAAFSSRGPVLDGRFKPELVAPGTNILSARTRAVPETEVIGWGNYNKDYMWSGGTSMSTPLAAGAAALMREYLTIHAGIATPSAALIKAAMINSATDMSPGQYGYGLKREIPESPVPNNVQGWGRINIADGVFPASPRNIVYYDETSGLNTGESKDHVITVSDAGRPLKINLSWTDYPGAPVAQGGLVNDLDLEVVAPSAMVHYPDHALKTTPVSTISYDDNIFVSAAPNSYAVRFTPASYPVYLDSVTFFLANAGSDGVTVYVYPDNGSGLPHTGRVLDQKVLNYMPTGFVTIALEATITSGDFHVAVELGSYDLQAIAVLDGNPDGRTSWRTIGEPWATSGYSAVIRSNVRYGNELSTSFDRVNNTVGVLIDTPEVGDYHIRVTGYNVPQGPQPYALVASGDIQKKAGPGDWVTISGTVTLAGRPLCAMVLANGQYMFTCGAGDDLGKYEMQVPLDEKSEIGLFAFVYGLAPHTQTLSATALQNDIAMQEASPESQSPTVTTTMETQGMPAGYARIYGAITLDGAPLCAMVLANGQHMFSCGDSNGLYDLTVPLDPSGQIGLMVFVHGLKPYHKVLP